MAIVKGRTPDHRGPRLGDGAGGSSERPSIKTRSRVLEDVGSIESDIRLTAAGTGASNQGVAYNFGAVDKASVGRYLFKAQSAASATADPLGAVEYAVIEVREETAGVFACAVVADLATTIDEKQTNIASSALVTDADTVDFAVTGGDADLYIGVATAQDATDLATFTGGVEDENIAAGDLFMLEARSTATEVWSVQRMV